MTRSIDPILVSLAPYTAVPSTLSLPIREPVSLDSVTIVSPPLFEERATGGTTNCSGQSVDRQADTCRQVASALPPRTADRPRKIHPLRTLSWVTNEEHPRS